MKKRNVNNLLTVGQNMLIKTAKAFLIFLFCSIITTRAELSYAQNTQINLYLKNASIEEFFKEIEKRSNYIFFYDKSIVSEKNRVSVDFKNENLEEILHKVLDSMDLSYAINDRQIVVTAKKSVQKRAESQPKDQQSQILIKGTVVDKDGVPLPGVNVFVENTGTGTVSDMNGNFTVKIYEFKTRVRFTFVGFAPKYVEIKDKEPLYITLMEETTGLDDVIVVGYGTQKKINLSGAVNQITTKELQDRPVAKLSQALQGAIPNLNVTFSGGTPGQDASINVRGTTSINGGGPLVLVDGIPGSIDRLTSNEVETITVLKDASASAIYGARGAFGVILITTKNAKEGKTRVSYSNNFGWSTPTISTDFITTGYDWMRLNDASIAHVGGYSKYTEQDMQELYIRRFDKTENPERPWITIQDRGKGDQYVYYGNYDWWDIMFNKWQESQNHNINLSGGKENLNYMLIGNYNSTKGIMKLNNDRYQSYSFRSKINAQLYKWLKVSNNTKFFHSVYNYYGQKNGGNANFTSINVHASPAYAPINPDGSATYLTGINKYTIGDGIYTKLVNGNTKGANRKYEFTTTTEATLNLAKGLNVIANYSYNLYTDPNYYRQVPGTYSLYPGKIEVADKANNNMLEEWQQFNHVHIFNVYGEYSKSFIQKHNLKVMAGFSQELHLAKKVTANRRDLLSEEGHDLKLGTGEQTVGGGSSEVALRGAFYRLNYDYKGKYLFETSARYDGTSRFRKGDRYGFFPSVSGAWRISEEAFFQPIITYVSNLKFRVSYGSLGNQDVDNYAYISNMNPGELSYILDGTIGKYEKAKYIGMPVPVSGDLTWEKVTSTNFGVDVNFFRNRLGISFDTYIRKTTGMLDSGLDLPGVFGASEPQVNAADLKTKGFEITLSWNDDFILAGKKFTYGVSGVLSDYRARITKMENETKLTYSNYEGKEIGEIWGFTTDGYFKSDAEAKAYPVDQSYLNGVRNDNNIGLAAGDIRFVDIDGDNKISSGKNTIDNPGDQRRLGNSTPRYQYGMNLNASWNNFDISVLFQGVGKCDWYPGNEADRFWGPFARPYYSFIPKDFESKLWTPDNPNAYFPRLLTYIALNAGNELRATNNRYLQDLAYCRLKNLTIGYTVPQQLTQKINISKVRVFLSGENLVTWTKLESDYIDPEQAIANANGRTYPFSRTISFGVNVSF